MNNRVKRLILFAQAVAGDIKALKLKIGNTDTLVTDDKTSTVNAINEVAGSSKEIKDSIEKFKTEIGINSEIAEANDISVNPFELLVPFIKNQISSGQTSDNEYSEAVYYIPKNTRTIKYLLNGTLSSNLGIKIKQGAFEKFVHFTSPIEDNFELPAEIDTSKEYTINKYDVFGHYLNTYKIVPQEQFFKNNNVADLINNFNNIIGIEQFKDNNYLGMNQVVIADENETNKIKTLLSQIDLTVPINYKKYIFLNKNLTKYYNFRTESWENTTDFTNRSLLDDILSAYFNDTDNKILMSNDANLEEIYTSVLTKNIYFINKQNFLSQEKIEEKYKASERALTNALYIDYNTKEYFNPITRTWDSLGDKYNPQIKPFVYNKYINTLKKANDNNINYYNGESNIYTPYSETSDLAPLIGFVDNENNLECNISHIYNNLPVILNINGTKFYDYILTKTWVDRWDTMQDAINSILQTNTYKKAIIPLKNKIDKLNTVMDTIDLTKTLEFTGNTETELNNALIDKDILIINAKTFNSFNLDNISNLQNVKLINLYDDYLATNKVKKLHNKIIVANTNWGSSNETITDLLKYMNSNTDTLFLSLIDNTNNPQLNHPTNDNVTNQQDIIHRYQAKESPESFYYNSIIVSKKLKDTKFAPLLTKLTYTPHTIIDHL